MKKGAKTLDVPPGSVDIVYRLLRVKKSKETVRWKQLFFVTEFFNIAVEDFDRNKSVAGAAKVEQLICFLFAWFGGIWLFPNRDQKRTPDGKTTDLDGCYFRHNQKQKFLTFTARIRRMGKVLFSRLSGVCLFTGRGGEGGYPNHWSLVTGIFQGDGYP